MKILQPHDIVNYIKTQRVEAGYTSYDRFRRFFGDGQTEQVTVSLVDSITMLPI